MRATACHIPVVSVRVNLTLYHQDVDAAMKLGAGYPMGPFELADYVGKRIVCCSCRMRKIMCLKITGIKITHIKITRIKIMHIKITCIKITLITRANS